jgi:FixJ family two-component response regulator
MNARPRILVVDDEEAILETMTFTFEDDYEVITSSSARDGLALLEREGPVSVVISDQRMPEMTGVEFLSRVFALHPTTVRIILTGFADMDAIIRAINDGHVYAYITKPWEPDQLKQVVRRAVDHHALAVENERLVGDLRASNLFLEAVMDELDTGALAIDAGGVVRAANRLAREYLGLRGDARGRPLDQVLAPDVLERVRGAAMTLESEAGCYQEMDLPVGRGVRLRVHARTLARPDGGTLGRVILAREISHEPLRRRFDEILEGLVSSGDGALRERLDQAQRDLASLVREAGSEGVASPGRAELRDRATRTLTAIEYWLAVDDALAREAFPDAQPLLDRMRLANQRWPQERLPGRVRDLARRVESYYESGENPKQPVL